MGSSLGEKMSEKLNELKKKLREIFQLDQTDLDFGIYKIMNEKSAEITDFLDNKLLTQVKDSFKSLENMDKLSIQKELEEAITQAKSLGANPDDLPKVKDLKAQLTNSVDVSVLENDVYSHLTNFFSRYYNGGDFMSLRRYKKDVYAIPYEGEEVKLHWANSDQYYIKTSENFKDYSFFIGEEGNKKSVHFKLVEAETEKDNNKSDKERRFMLVDENPISIENKELIIRFEYKIDENKKQQKVYNDKALEVLLTELSKEDYHDFSKLLSLVPTEKNKNRTLLEKHLTYYTAKNSFDYFIHKDLKGFLDRELDFYIKNEVLNIDDLDELNIKQSLGKAKAIKTIAQKLITFLGQLEDFQKKLWLKKKFVVETNYCITLDKVDEKFYSEIANNKKQLEEWEKLFAISDIQDDTTNLSGDVLFSETDETKKIEFLKQNPYLQVDTKFFSPEFKYKLLAMLDNLDEQINGLLINSDNFHALNLLQEKYKEQIKCIYIDPPYNTNASKIIYKNSYEHSSWLSLLQDRLLLSKQILPDDGIITIAIDDFEMPKLWEMMNNLYGFENHLGTVAIRINPKGRMTARKISAVHEYTLLYGNGESAHVKKLPENPEEKTHNYKQDENGVWYLPNNLRKQGVDSEAERPNGKMSDRYFPIYYDVSTGKVSSKDKLPITIFPIDSSGHKRIWRRGFDVIDDMYKKGDIWVKEVNGSYQVYYKFYGGLDGKMVQSMWTEAECSASDYGTKILDNILGKREQFSYPKAPFPVKRSILAMANDKNVIILDFFAGSGTTGHATIELNREDSGNRKYILVEMGKYFNTVTKPRVQKVAYSKDWKNGKPVDRDGVSQIIKYMSLESYEDACNNLQKNNQQLIISPSVEEQYKLNYMFDIEYSDSLLNIQMFENPFDYKMNIIQGNETKLVNIDLIETFNYLIGLNVSSMYFKEGFMVVEGNNRDKENIIVIWRNIKEKSNEDLNNFLVKRRISASDFEFDKIYVNGDNNIQNSIADGNQFKVVLIEEEFRNRMFDMQEV